MEILANLRKAVASRKEPKLNWYVPIWFITPRAWRDYRRHLLNRSSLVRIAGASIAAYLCLAMLCKWLVPNVILPNVVQLSAVLMQICLMVFILPLVQMLIPPCITIFREKIVYQAGQRPRIIKCEWINKAYVTAHSNDRVVLRICYASKTDKQRVLVVAIRPSVDLDRLSELLPQLPIVRDARVRHNWKLTSNDDRVCA